MKELPVFNNNDEKYKTYLLLKLFSGQARKQ
jgi:hypothetical protein